MKIIKLLLFCLPVLCLLTACPKEQEGPGGQTTDIDVTVYKMNTTMPLNGVVVEMTNGGVTTPVTTTNHTGEVDLQNVTKNNLYSFSKNSYIQQRVTFKEYANLDKLNLYMKQASTDPSEIYIKGKVYNESSQPISGVAVKVNTQTTTTDSQGRYGLSVSLSNQYQVNYKKDSREATLKLNLDQDTAVAEVYIDGFTVDTLNLVKDTMTIDKKE